MIELHDAHEHRSRYTIFAVATLLVMALPAMGGEHLSITSQFVTGYDPYNQPIPRCQNGYLVHYNDNSLPATLTMFNRRGNRVVEAKITIPDVPYIRIKDVAVSSAGRIAVAGTARNEVNAAHFISWLNQSGTIQFIVRTDEFSPEKLTFAADGTLWAFGGVNTRKAHDMLKHYDGEGRLLLSTLSSSNYLRDRGLHPTSGAMMASTADRLGILMPHVPAWVEISLVDGAVLGRWSLPTTDADPYASGSALTRNGDAYIALRKEGGSGVAVFRLDRTAEKWVPIDFRDPGGNLWVQILGNDGNDLVTTADWRIYSIMQTSP